jgi:hypothetical protein
MTLVAPIERFNALAILVTPFFSLAIVFNVRTSSFDHARRIAVFFLANFRFLVFRNRACSRPSSFGNSKTNQFLTKDFSMFFGDHTFGDSESEIPGDPNDAPPIESETATTPRNNEAHI